LLVDRNVAFAWDGAFGEGTDYARAISPFEEDDAKSVAELLVGGQTSIVWDVPAGTVDVWRERADAIVLVWSTDDGRDPDLADGVRGSETGRASLSVPSGWLVISWAAESLHSLYSAEPEDSSSLSLSVGRAALVVAMPPGSHDGRAFQPIASGDFRRTLIVEPGGR
jgi:uncharacterized protein YheU (UPF0270 family)